jgi:hypothetical protein
MTANDDMKSHLDDEPVGQKRYWLGTVDEFDSFNRLICDEFIDGRVHGDLVWAIFTPDSWKHFGCKRLGTGYGQRYRKQADGRWLKVEG